MKIAILAGEKSGDNYAGILAAKIKELRPGTFILGTGGSRMESVSDSFVGMPCGTMGFTGVIRNLPLFYGAYRSVLKAVERENPSLVVLIDNPGFNLKIAAALGAKYPCYYYIPPKIWAHHYGRINLMKKHIRAVIPVFPFEKDIYNGEGIECHWFGHPASDLLERPREGSGRRLSSMPSGELPAIGILPGSREEEVSFLLPEFIRIAAVLAGKRNSRFLLSASEPGIRKLEEKILSGNPGVKMEIMDDLYGVISSSSLILAASGTVNLEVALMGKPLLVFYKTTGFNYRLARMVVKLKDVSPVNLMLGRRAVPEYIQEFPPEEIIGNILDLLDGGPLYRQETESFKTLSGLMGQGDVSLKVAGLLISRGEREKR